MPQIGQRPHNPIIAPGPILLGHANNQFLNFSVDPWPARGSPFLRAIELAGDEPSVPCQDGVRQGGSRHLAECLATQSTANLAELRSPRVRKLQPPLQLAPQDPVFSSQILIPQQQLLVHRPRNVGQDTCPLHESPPPHLSADPQRAPLIASKKCSGRHAARLRRDGITARLSCSFNFLATRDGVEEAIEARGAIPFYLPAYSPDLNPIEQLFAKLKALLRKVAAYTLKNAAFTVRSLCKAVASCLNQISRTECAAYLANSGYGPPKRKPL